MDHVARKCAVFIQAIPQHKRMVCLVASVAVLCIGPGGGKQTGRVAGAKLRMQPGSVPRRLNSSRRRWAG